MSGTAISLVLNATYEPLCVVPVRRAAVLVLTDKAVPVADGDGLLRSTSTVLVAPAVVRLTRFVRVPFRAQVSLTRRAVFARDGGRCVYCGGPANSVDHVVPRSRGGTHTWDNVVAACRPCNAHKEDRFLSETHMRLRRTPTAPTGRIWMLLAMGTLRPDWEPYLRLPERASASLSA